MSDAEFYPFVRKPRAREIIDRAGMRQERLLVVCPMRRAGDEEIYWECRCDCGAVTMVRASSLKHGQKSCGCQQRERAIRNLIESGASTRIKPRHGYCKPSDGRCRSTTYIVWYGMKRRCVDPNLSSYKYYGGRGISYDPRWEVFENFLADMGERPGDTTLDRIDNDGNYAKANCRWAARRDNQNNRSNTSLIEFRGRRVPLQELVREQGINAAAFRQRLKLGWSIEDAATTPIAHRRARTIGAAHRG